MSNEQVERIREHFALFDKDANGFIESKELGIALRSLGFHVEESHLSEIVKEFDTNKDGKVDFDEFYNLVSVKMKNPLSEIELKEAFKLFDKDGNGKVTCSELKQALTNFGEKLSQQEAEEFLEDADTNGDGELDIAELTRFLLAQKY